MRILIADDHPVVREGLSAMLSRKHDIQVVGEAGNGSEAIDKAKELQPDIILMDLRMPEVDGVEAMHQITAENPDIKFIVLTTYDNDEHIFKGIEAGARAYLLKDAPREDLFKAIRAVYKGESLIQPAIAGKVLARFAELSRQAEVPDSLSERELEVLTLMANGAPNKKIATELFITESTVKSHVQTVFQKLGVNSRTEAISESIKKGLIHL